MDKQYKSAIIEDLKQDYKSLFDEIRHEDSSKKLMKTMSNDVVSNLRELNGIIKGAKTTEERKEVIKDVLSLELSFCETVINATDKNTSMTTSNSLEDTKNTLEGCLKNYDRDLVNKENYQVAYSRYNTHKLLSKKGLPKDGVIFFANSEKQKILQATSIREAYDSPTFQINLARSDNLIEIKKVYEKVQTYLLADLLPKEVKKENKKSKGKER